MMAYRKIAGVARIGHNRAGFSQMITGKYGVARRGMGLPALIFLNASEVLLNTIISMRYYRLPEQERKFLTHIQYNIFLGRTTLVTAAYGRAARQSNTMKVINPASLNFFSIYSSEMSQEYVYGNHRRGFGLGLIQDYAVKPIMIYPHISRTKYFPGYPINLINNSLVSENLLALNNSLTHKNPPTYNNLLIHSNSLTHNNTAIYKSSLIHDSSLHYRLLRQGRKFLTHTEYNKNSGRTTLVAAAYGIVARQSNAMKVINPASFNFVSIYSSNMRTGYVSVNHRRGSGFGVNQDDAAKQFMVYPHPWRINYLPGYPVNLPDNSLVPENMLTHNNSLIHNKSLLYNRHLTYNNYLTHNNSLHYRLLRQGLKFLTQTKDNKNSGRTTLVTVAYRRAARQSNTIKVINPASLNSVSVYSSKMSTGYVPVNLRRGSGFGAIQDYAAKPHMSYPHFWRINYLPRYLVNLLDNALVLKNLLTHSNYMTQNKSLNYNNSLIHNNNSPTHNNLLTNNNSLTHNNLMTNNRFLTHKSPGSRFGLSMVNRRKLTDSNIELDYPMTELEHHKQNPFWGKEYQLKKEHEAIEKNSKGGTNGTTGQTASPVGRHKNVDANMIPDFNNIVDVNRIADQVYQVIERKIKIERERRGM